MGEQQEQGGQRRRDKNETIGRRGSLTVEAALVLPVVFLLVCLVIEIGMVQFYSFSTRAEAMRIANRTAMSWNLIGGTEHNLLSEDVRAMAEKSGRNAITAENYKEHDPYRFFTELFSAGTTKKANIRAYLNASMSGIELPASGIEVTTDAQIASDRAIHLFHRFVTVKLSNAYVNPLDVFLENLGISVFLDSEIEARARLTEPAEFVRMVSYIKEVMEKKQAEGK